MMTKSFSRRQLPPEQHRHVGEVPLRVRDGLLRRVHRRRAQRSSTRCWRSRLQQYTGMTWRYQLETRGISIGDYPFDFGRHVVTRVPADNELILVKLATP